MGIVHLVWFVPAATAARVAVEDVSDLKLECAFRTIQECSPVDSQHSQPLRSYACYDFIPCDHDNCPSGYCECEGEPSRTRTFRANCSRWDEWNEARSWDEWLHGNDLGDGWEYEGLMCDEICWRASQDDSLLPLAPLPAPVPTPVPVEPPAPVPTPVPVEPPGECAFQTIEECGSDGLQPRRSYGCQDIIPCTYANCPSGYCECHEYSFSHTRTFRVNCNRDWVQDDGWMENGWEYEGLRCDEICRRASQDDSLLPLAPPPAPVPTPAPVEPPAPVPTPVPVEPPAPVPTPVPVEPPIEPPAPVPVLPPASAPVTVQVHQGGQLKLEIEGVGNLTVELERNGNLTMDPPPPAPSPAPSPAPRRRYDSRRRYDNSRRRDIRRRR